jgi:GNAT superfamily N-acetyltransferase
MNITFKRLTDCTPEEMISAWNSGFEGYIVQMEMTVDLFFTRLVNEGLSLQQSFVAFDKEQPVAIVVNGFRTINGKKTAWNGGTGVAVPYRGKGVSRLIMEETLSIYKEADVEVATLEAIKENEKAIRLYEKFGYRVTDSLVFMSGTPELTRNSAIQTKSVRPEQLQTLNIYKENTPWQCQWQSVKSGEAQVYYDQNDNLVGYSLYKRVWNPKGDLEKVFLYQLELFQGIEGIHGILAAIANQDKGSVIFTTVNAPISNPITQYLMENGFLISTEQVQMVKK